MRSILHWTDTYDPKNFQGGTHVQPDQVVDAVIAHLRAGHVAKAYKGTAKCRICRMALGSESRTDGTFVWPDQTEHYVIAHRVWTPEHEVLANAVIYNVPPPPVSGSSENLMGPNPPMIRSVQDLDDYMLGPEGTVDEIDIGVLDFGFDEKESSSEEAEGDEIGFDDLFGDTIPYSPEEDDRTSFSADGATEISGIARPTQPTLPSLISLDSIEPQAQQANARAKRRPRRDRTGGRPQVQREQTGYNGDTTSEHSLNTQYGMSDPAQAIFAAYPQAGLPLAHKIVTVAYNVGADPFDLANLINFESAHTFKPDVQHPASKATGLIQFYPGHTKRRLGITTTKLARMNAIEQMEWVQAYLDSARQGAPLDSMQKVAMAVFYPVAIKWSPHRQFPPNVQAANKGIATPADYVRFMMKSAKLGEGGGGHGPASQEGSLLDQASKWWSSLWATPEGGPSPQAPQATRASAQPAPRAQEIGIRWSVAGSARARLQGPRGTFGPGTVPPGRYHLEIWNGSGWAQASPTALNLRSGHEYQLSTVGGGLDWGEKPAR